MVEKLKHYGLLAMVIAGFALALSQAQGWGP